MFATSSVIHKLMCNFLLEFGAGATNEKDPRKI